MRDGDTLVFVEVRMRANDAYGGAGGVKLFNGDNQTGGDRLMCAPFVAWDNTAYSYSDDLNDKEHWWNDQYDEIWGSFQLKTESLRLRAYAGCIVKVKLYSEYNTPNHALMATYEHDRIGKSTHTKSIELPSSIDDVGDEILDWAINL